MSSTYSTNLAIELIGTGDQAGTWGTTTNTNLGTLIEQAISGYVTQAVATGTDTTITIPNGATGVARNMYIELTGTGGASTNLIVPANKKLYFIFNNTSSGQVTVKVSGQTGVSVPNKAKMILVSNGTDVVDATNYVGNLSAASANITVLTSASATVTNLLATSLTVSSGSTLNGGVVINEPGADVDFRVESDTDANCLFVDASANNVGIGTSSPAAKLDVAGSARFQSAGNWMEFGSNVLTSLNNDGAEIRSVISTESNPTYSWKGDANTGIFTPGSDIIGFTTGGSERLRLDASGNLGLGVTPSAWNSGYKAIQNGRSSFVNDDGNRLQILNNAYIDSGGAYKYIASSYAWLDWYIDGQRRWYTAPSGTAGNTITFTQAMTLDASGNLGVGTTSLSGRLNVYNSDNAAAVVFYLENGGTSDVGIRVRRSAADVGFIGNGSYVITGGGSTDFGIQAVNSLLFATGGPTERARIDAAGNFGLGVTPSAWGSGWKALQVGDFGGAVSYSGGALNLGLNTYNNGTNYIYTATSTATLYQQVSGEHRFFNAPSGTAGNAITFTQAMTLDASGNLGLAANKVFGSGNGYAGNTSAASSATLELWDTNGNTKLFNAWGSGNLLFGTNNTERARITSGGSLLVNTTNNSTAANGEIICNSSIRSGLPTTSGYNNTDSASLEGLSGRVIINHLNGTASGGLYAGFGYNGGGIGSITQDGTTGVLYNLTSDRRLKENIVPAPDAGSKIDAIQIVSHGWKSAPNEHVEYGVIAQDLYEVAPRAVKVGDDGEEVTDAWGVDYSKLVPMLVKEIQSLRSRVAALEAE